MKNIFNTSSFIAPFIFCIGVILLSSMELNAQKTFWSSGNPFEQKVFIENKGQFSPPPAGMPVSSLGIKWFDGLKGQGVIKYACNIGGVSLLFTEKGLTYSHTESVPMTEEEKEIAKKNLPAAAAQEGEEDEEENLMSYIPHFLYMNWIGANPDVKIVAEDMVTEYFTYANPADTSGKTGIKALAYKKILYKNIYPNIDVEYTLPDSTPLSFRRGVGGEVGGEAGIKYSIILHPGADLSLIKMQYIEPTPSPSGEDWGEVILEQGKEGEVIIKTSFGDFIDHAPLTYYSDGTPLVSSFNLSGNTVSFALNLPTPNSQLTTPDSLLTTPNSLLTTPNSLLPTPDSLLLSHGSIIIDPWTTFPSFTYSSTNSAYDVDYDNNGNVYVFGGKSDPGPQGSTWQVKKFNSSGAIQWTYTCVPYGGNDGYYYGDFCVNRATGSSYIISKAFHYSFAATIDKVNSAGTYVNRISDSYAGTEWWRIVYNTSTNKLIVGGGGPTYAYQGYIIDTNLTAVNYINVLGAGDVFHDIALLAVDGANNCYMATACSFQQSCYGSYNNVMLKVPGSTLSPIAWSVSDGYSLTEAASVRYIEPSPSSYCSGTEAIGMNGMAVSNNYLYTYDAATLKKWDKNTGALISSVNVSSLLTGNCVIISPPTFYTVPCIVTWGGIAVDKCDNIYVGSNNTVKTYDVNLNLISDTVVTNTVYDLAIGPGNKLYVCGKGFVSELAAFPTPVAEAGPNDTICLGDSVQLSASGGTTYSWSPATGLSDTNIFNPVANPAATTTYYVTVSDMGCSDMDSVTVTVNAVLADAGPDVIICSGNSAQLTASGGTSYSWSPAAGLSATNIFNPVANPAATTLYTVTVSDLGCSNIDSVLVTVQSALVANAGADTAICAGDSTQLNATGGTAYAWSPATGLSCTNCSNPMASPATTTTYTLTVSSGSCPPATDQVTVTVNTVPVADAGADTTICSGQNVTLSATGGGTYLWSNSATTSSITVSPVGTTTYSVTVSNSGCSDMDSVRVTVNTLPVADAGADTTICSGQNVTLTATGGGTYLWSNSATSSSITVMPLNTTTYSVTVNNSGCTASDNVTITVNALPLANAGADTAICSGQNVTLTATGGGTYLWSNSATTSSITVLPLNTTTYSVTVTNSGCSASDNVTVTVNAMPVPEAGADTSVCSGQNVTLTATGGGTYLWSNSATTSGITVLPLNTTTYSVTVNNSGCTAMDSVTVSVIAAPTAYAGLDQTVCTGGSATLTATGGGNYAWSNGANTASITVSPASTTSYTVTVTSANGCTASDQAVVNVTAALIAEAGPNQNICVGDTAALTASGGVTYQWSSGGSTATIFVAPASTTTYTVTVSSGSCTPATDNVTIFVNPLPLVSVTPNTTSVCNGYSDTLTASGAATYSWSPASGLNTTTGATVIANPAVSTTYTVTGTSLGCSSSASVIVTVLPAVVADAGIDQTICSGDSAILTATGGGTYSWSNNATTASTVVSPASAATYTVTVSNGACTGTDAVTVFVNTTPVAAITGDTLICLGTSASLTASGGLSYLWSTSDTSQTITVMPASGTTYSVTVSNAGCSSSASITVNPVPMPSANAGNDTTINIGGSAYLHGSGGILFSWSPSSSLSCSDCANPVANPSSTTTYVLVVSDANGCADSDTVTVTVDFICGEVFVPNAFSPNADGVNELECVYGNCITTIYFAIYDRWGEKVFETSDPKECWDGTYKGKKLNTAVFDYYMKCTLLNGQEIFKHGDINLIR